MQLNVDLIYPIGSIYFSVNTISPATLFGGTWKQITDDAYLKFVTTDGGSLGGTSSDHKIPISSMPKHRHYNQPPHSDYGSSSGLYGVASNVNGSGGNVNFYSDYTGGGEAYYPYYLGVYGWIRTA